MRSKAGFTLLEAIIVLAVMTTAVFAVPAIYAYLDNQGVALAADRLRADLQLARIMAVHQKQTCAIVLNQPASNQYFNSLNRQIVDLSAYHGEVRLLEKGPDGGKTGTHISFNRQGMSTSAAAVDVYLADRKMQAVYRIRVLNPGGISLTRWGGDNWE